MAENSGGEAKKPEAAPKKPSKREAVERSFKKLGNDAMPKAVQADVKKRFGLDVSDSHISLIKAELAGKAPAAQKPAAGQASAARPAAAAKKGAAVSLDDVLALK